MDKLHQGHRRALLGIYGNFIFGLLLAILLLGAPGLGHAQTNRLNGPPRNIRIWGYSNTVITATNATTAYTDEAVVTNTPVNDPNATNSAGFAGASAGKPYEHLQVQWSADVTKATATTVTCAVFVNGAIVTGTTRTVGVGEFTVAGEYDVANTVTGAQTVKVQCKSGDTNTATINQVSLLVNEVY